MQAVGGNSDSRPSRFGDRSYKPSVHNCPKLTGMDGQQAVVYYHLQDEINSPPRFVALITLALILAAIIAFLVFKTHFTRPRD